MTTPKPKQRSLHEYAQLFPDMSAAEFDDLKADIKKRGLIVPILLAPDGRIADGKHRYKACRLAKVSPSFEKWTKTEAELLDHVVALNIKRRHLNESQRSWVAAKLVTMPSHRPKKTDSESGAIEPLISREQAAAQMNVSVEGVKRARKVMEKGHDDLKKAVADGVIPVSGAATVSTLTTAQQRAVVKRVLDGGARNAKDAMRQLRTEKQIKEIEKSKTKPTKGKYAVVVVDPPWRFEKRREDETQRGKVQYPDMSEAEIASVKIPGAENSILLLWTTNAHLVTGEASRVVRAWGYEPKTLYTWVKPKMGVGDWGRGKSEHVIVAVKGKYKLKSVPPTVFEAPAPKVHSQKPDEFYKLVEKCCPGSKCEMFARKERKGWKQVGAELGSVK